MTFAFQEMDPARAAAPIPEETARSTMQVLIVTPDPARAAAIAAPMQTDPGVRATLATGRLADLARDPGRTWRAYDFVVFQTAPDDMDDMAAVQCLRAQPGARMQCIAMLDGPVTEAARAALRRFGVAEVLPMPTPATPTSPEDRTTEGRVTRRLTLSLPETETGWQKTTETVPDAAPPSAPVADAGAAPAALDRADADPADAGATDARPTDAGPGRQSPGKLTAVLRARGGSGATTIAVNLALDLAAEAPQGPEGARPRVALIDLDIQNGAVGVLMDMPDSAPFAALLSQGALPGTAFLDAAMTRHDGGVDVLAAPDIFAPLGAVTPAMIEALLDAALQRYDQVLIDMPQAMMDWAQPIFERAALALVVTDTSVPAIKRTRRLIDLLAEDHMTLSVQVVVNREKRPLFLTPAQKEAAALLGRPLEHWVPEDAARARAALDSGVPLVLAARQSRAARSIARLRAALFTAHKTRKDTV